MNPFAFSGLLIFISCLSMTILVLIKSYSYPINRLWAVFTSIVALWGFGSFKAGLATSQESALFWWKIALIGVIFIPSIFVHFTCLFLNKNRKILIISYYFTSILFLAALITNNLIADLNIVFHSFYYTANPNIFYKIFFLFWISVMFHAYTLVFKNRTFIDKTKDNQIKYFFLTTAAGYLGGISNFFPTLGINIYPYGNFLVAIFPVATTYVILKYQLMDINIVIKKSLVYSSLVTAVTLIFLISVLVLEKIFHHYIPYKDLLSSILIAGTITLIFTPLKNKIQDLVDRIFFKATPIEMAYQNEKLKAVATMASSLAHEIKNPLTSLKTFTEYLPQKKNDPEFIKTFERIVPQEIDRINNLLCDLLAFAKPSAPLFQNTNPSQIIENLISMLENRIKAHKILISKNLDNSHQIQADPNQLKQALLNIILNAIDAMPHGGTLTIKTENINNQYLIEISDTGSGIDPKDLPHIFEPFYTKKEKGTGLGLAITQGIIEKHGGKILVESNVNQGTTFRIKILI